MAYDDVRVDVFLHPSDDLVQEAVPTQPVVPKDALVPLGYTDSKGVQQLHLVPCVLWEGMYYFLYAWGWKHEAGGMWQPVVQADNALARPLNDLGPFGDLAPMPWRKFLTAPATLPVLPYRLQLELDLTRGALRSLAGQCGPPRASHVAVDPSLLAHQHVHECAAWDALRAAGVSLPSQP